MKKRSECCLQSHIPEGRRAAAAPVSVLGASMRTPHRPHGNPKTKTLALLLLSLLCALLHVATSAEEAAKQRGVIPFRGEIAAVDKVAKTITVGQRTFHVTSETKLMIAEKVATLDDARVGREIRGSYKKAEDGKLVAQQIWVGPPPGPASVRLPTGRLSVSSRWPTRSFEGRRVDLTPLFSWWTNAVATIEANDRLYYDKKKPLSELPIPARPMPAWVHIHGVPETVGSAQWKIDALVTAQPGERAYRMIILRHPPEKERVRFETLRARIAYLTGERQHDSARASGLNDSARRAGEKTTSLDELRQASPLLRRELQGASEQAHRSSRAAFAASDRASARLNQLSAELVSAQQELAKIPVKGNSPYAADAFALRTGEIYNGLPVYDLGYIPGL